MYEWAAWLLVVLHNKYRGCLNEQLFNSYCIGLQCSRFICILQAGLLVIC